MSLQVRLRHPLGDRLIELSPRPAQQPVVIGRMAGAEVQVPSVAVAPKHAVLFVHQGRWVVQDSSGANGAGTFVNGRRIAAATFLKVGDIVALGADPKSPTVEIDPEGPAEGRTGNALAEPGAAGVAAPGVAAALPPQVGQRAPQAMPPQPPRVPAMPPQPGFAYGAVPPQQAYAAHPPQQQQAYAAAVPVTQWGGEQEAAAADDGDSIAWGTPSDAPVRPTYARRPKQDNTGVYITLGILGLLVVGGLFYFISQKKKETVDAPPPKKVTTAPAAGGGGRKVEPKSNNIFGVPDKPTPPRRTGTPAADANAQVTANAVEITATIGVGRKAASSAKEASSFAAPGGGRATAAAPAAPSPGDEAAEVLAAKNDERMKTQEWRNITTSYYARNPLDALLRMDDYEKLHPGVLTEQLNKLRDGVVDRLWWERIDQLWTRREDLAKRLAEVDQALLDEINETFKKSTLIPEKNSLVQKINAVDDILQKEMGYTADKPPLLTDENDLNRLRQYRDNEYYAKWKTNVLASVHRRRSLPFEWDK